MAREDGQEEGEDDETTKTDPNGRKSVENGEAQTLGSEEEEEEEEEEEPRLKYASLTKNLKSVYRNGDATSSFLVAGDKMIIGTHNGNIHVFSVPSLQSIRVYHAHTASISSLTISPYPPPVSRVGADIPQKFSNIRTSSPAPPITKAIRDPPSRKINPIPPTPSAAIYIGSSSIDGNVCVSSLADTRDVLLRNFGRPVKAVGLSPEYKSDRSYLSGGLAGLLVLTVGGQTGTRTTATVTGATASASGWLGSIGLGSNTGKDQVLHSGEGAISTIKWSLSGKFVVWVNEQGIKIMRSNLYLDSAESEFAWKRISHIDHPNRPGWDEMAGTWKAHLEWINEEGLETEDQCYGNTVDDKDKEPVNGDRLKQSKQSQKIEKLVVGWSGTIWIINMHPGVAGKGKEIEKRRIGHAEVVTILRIDCIISGISLYTPNYLLVIAYITSDEDHPLAQKATRHGVSRRQNALQPEMRIIDITTKEEVSVADALKVSRYEALSATDYHLGVLPAMRTPQKTSNQRGRIEALGGGIEAIGGGILDATMYPARLFSSTASIRSGESPSSSKPSSEINVGTNLNTTQEYDIPPPSLYSDGMKIFIHSPFDCIIATKPTESDRLAWLDSHSMYEEAWKLLEHSPEATQTLHDRVSNTSTISPSKGSLVEFFADDISQTEASADRILVLQSEKEKRRIGERWLQQLVSSTQWEKAGQVAGQVLGSSSRWEHWIMVFAQANKYDEITPFVPDDQIDPPLPSIVYELILGHYVSKDRPRFRELLERWPVDLFEARPIIEAIYSKFKSGEVGEDTVEDGATGRDWRILYESLAKLYLATGRPRNALRCFIRLQDADSAMRLIAEAHLIDAVADDIPGFIILRISKERQRLAPLSELDSLSREPVRLLVSEAHHGIVLPEMVVSQLTARYGMPNPYLFFYFRALWNGDTAPSFEPKTTARTSTGGERLLALEGKTLVSDYADTAVELFAEYDRSLLMTFLKSSQSYTLRIASRICEQRSFIPELVYLLSKEGRTARALRLIIDSLNDVSQAIAFAIEQNDNSLWDDLINYSMNKPVFIRGLLEQVGTSIDPLKLVKRIPPGLEIQGLKEALTKMLKEFEMQESISKGVARVLRGEVNTAMQQRSNGLRTGIRIDVPHGKKSDKRISSGGQHHVQPKDIKPGSCATCGDAINDPETPPQHLLAFPCSHIFHLACLLKQSLPPDTEPPAMLVQYLNPSVTEEGEEGFAWDVYDKSIGPKVDRARLLRTVLGDGCPLEEKRGGQAR